MCDIGWISIDLHNRVESNKAGDINCLDLGQPWVWSLHHRQRGAIKGFENKS